MITVRVERQIEAAHANGPPDSKCFTKHGHSWGITVDVQVGAVELDEWGWGVDFTLIKHVIDAFDHQDLNTHLGFQCELAPHRALQAPDRLPPSAENLARVIFWDLVEMTGKWPTRVLVSEGHGNLVEYEATVGVDTDPRRWLGDEERQIEAIG